MNSSIKIAKFGITTGIGNTLLFGIENIAVLYVGAHMVVDGAMTLGMLFAFQAYKGQFSGRAQALIGELIAYRMLGLHLQRLADIIHTDKEDGIEEPDNFLKPLDGRITVRNLSFRYAEHEPYVIQDLSFTIEAGECVALIGPSGCGKTTLLKLITGLLQPTEGEILIDDQPLRAIGPKAFRRQIGVVMQDDMLLSGTIAENISFFDPQSSMDRIQDCARAAAIHDDIMRMPMTYQSLIGDMGSILSGGQKQRVLIARALYRTPRMLFLDEGTANLDTESEARIIATLKAMPGTRVLIAHRDSMIQAADRQIALQPVSAHGQTGRTAAAE